MGLVLPDKGTLDDGRAGRGFAEGDLGDDVRLADDRTTAGTDLLAVILDDVGSRTARVGTGGMRCGLGRLGSCLRLGTSDGSGIGGFETGQTSHRRRPGAGAAPGERRTDTGSGGGHDK